MASYPDNTNWLHAALESVSDAVLLIDLDGAVLFLNGAASRVTGRQMPYAAGLPLDALCAMDAVASASGALRLPELTPNAPPQPLPDTFAILDAGGGSHPVTGSLTAALDDSGAVCGAILTARERSITAAMPPLLRARTDLHRRIVEGAGQGIWSVDHAWRITYANTRMCDMLMTRNTDLTGRLITDFADAAGRARLQSLQPRRGRPSETAFEMKFLRCDGQELWAIVAASPISDAAGHFAGAFGIVTDISERKRAEQALRESEERFRAIAGHSADCVLWFGAGGELLWVNPTVERLTGYSVPRCYVMPGFPASIVHPEDRDAVAVAFGGAPEGSSGNDLEFRIVTREGETRWCSVSWQPIYDDASRPLGTRCGVRDISDRKQAQEALREADRRMNALFEYSPIPMWEDDLSAVKSHLDELRRSGVDLRAYLESHAEEVQRLGSLIRITGLNAACVEFFEAESRGELMRSLTELFDETAWAAFQEGVLALADGQQSFQCDLRLRTRQGRRKMVSLWLRVVPGSGNSLERVVGSFVDHTARKEAEDTMRTAQGFAQALLSASPDLIYINDLVEHCSIYTNQSSNEFLGYDPTELVAMGPAIIELIHPDDSVGFIDHLGRLSTSADNGVHEVTYRMRHRDGDWRTLRCRDSVFQRAPDGTPQQILGFAEDITARVRAEAEVREHEAETAAILDNAPLTMMLVNDTMCVERINQAGAELADDEPAGMLGARAPGAIGCAHVDEDPRGCGWADHCGSCTVRALIDDVVRSRASRRAIEASLPLRGPHGVRDASLVVTASSLHVGGRWTTLVSVLDITERRLAEEARRVSEARYRRMFDQSTEGTAIADAETGILLECNQAFLQLTGYAREELIGQPQSILHAPADVVDGFSDTFADHRATHEGEVLLTRIRKRSGELRDVEIKASMLDLGDHRIVQGFFRDVTETLRRQSEREFTVQLLRTLNDADDEHALAGAVAEHLRHWSGCTSAAIQLCTGGTWRLHVAPDGGDGCGVDGCSDGPAAEDRCLCRAVAFGTADECGGFLTPRGSLYVGHGSDLAGLLPPDRACSGARAGAESLVMIPLRSGGETLGILQMSDVRPERFTAREVTFLEESAHHIATAVANRHAEALIRESEARQRIAMEAGEIGMWDWRLDTGVITWHGRHEALWGFEPGAFDGTLEAFYRGIHPDDIEGVQQELMQSRRELRPYRNEHRVVWPDGSVHWVAATGEWMLDRGGVVTGMLGVVADVTERRMAEQTLRDSASTLLHSEQHLHEAQELAAIGSFRYDLAQNSATWSPQLHRLCEVPPDQPPLAWADIAATVAPEDAARVHAIIDDAMQSGARIDVQYGIRLPSGVTRFHHLRAKVRVDASGRAAGVRGTVQDVSDRFALEAQLRQAQKMESVGRLAGGVAHDFNNMLQVILGHAEMTLMRDDLAHDLREDVQAIQDAAEHSAAVTRQLLAFARKQTATPEVLDLNLLIARMQSILRRLINENVHLRWRPGAEVWPVRIDPSQVDQILANVVVNARDAIDGSGTITIETANVTLDDSYCRLHPGCAPGKYVRLAISDTGRGMDEETLRHIFEPFYTTKEHDAGTGLGLAMVYGIAKQNGGYINVYSEQGHGTNVTVYLPRADAEAAAPPAPRARRQTRKAQGGTETILIAEDEDRILRLARAVLEQQGYTVFAANGPREALKIAAQTGDRIDLLLTDIVMPGMNGKELYDQISDQHPGVRCLYMSGYTANVIAQSGILPEGVNFVEKPFTVETLSTRVRAVLDH